MSDAYGDVISGIGRDVYDRMLQALQTGRWPDGRMLTDAQRENTMQAVIAWGEAHLPPEERIGYIDRGRKAGDSCDDPQPLNWAEDPA